MLRSGVMWAKNYTLLFPWYVLGDPEVTANLYCILRICIVKVAWFAVYICGNFWVTQHITQLRLSAEGVSGLPSNICTMISTSFRILDTLGRYAAPLHEICAPWYLDERVDQNTVRTPQVDKVALYIQNIGLSDSRLPSNFEFVFKKDLFSSYVRNVFRATIEIPWCTRLTFGNAKKFL